MPKDILQKIREDFAQFQKKTSEPELEKLQAIIHDYSLSWEQFTSALSPSFVQFLLALLKPEMYGLSGGNIPKEMAAEIASARIFAERELQAFLKHPAIVNEISWQKQYRKGEELARRGLYKNPHVHIAQHSYFEDEDGMLMPRVQLAMAARSDDSVVVIDCDPEDLLMLAEDVVQIARRELERCVPFSEMGAVKLSLGDFLSDSIYSIEQDLTAIRKLAAQLGLEINEGGDEESHDEESGK